MKVFEHQRLYVGQQGFQQHHLDALLKLNEYHNWKYFKPISKGIQFTQYVGVIQIDNLIIEVHPKVDKYDADEKWQNVLLDMLKACGKLKVNTTGVARVSKSHLNLLEIYFELFLSEIDYLQRRGLIKQYRRQTKNTKALKGKLEFAGHLQKNSIHKERFYTRHQVYDTDHILHQVLYKALNIIGTYTKGTRLYTYYKRMALNFPEVSKDSITVKQINAIKLNRKSKDYKYALELARLIILNYSPSIVQGQERMLSLMFNMNVLWETYVLIELRKALRNTDISIIGQGSKPFWNTNRLRPDIVLKKGNETFVIDTKWKCPTSNKPSVEDLRQMYAYGRFWDAQKVLLLYPGKPQNNQFLSFENEDFLSTTKENIKHQCKMGFVSVLNEHNELSKTLGKDVLNLLDFNFE